MALSGSPVHMIHWVNTTDSVSLLHYSDEEIVFQGESVPRSKGMAGPRVQRNPPEITTLEPIRHQI